MLSLKVEFAIFIISGWKSYFFFIPVCIYP